MEDKSLTTEELLRINLDIEKTGREYWQQKSKLVEEENKLLREEILQLRLTPQIPESVIRKVWEHGVNSWITSCYDPVSNKWEDYSEEVGQIVVDEMKCVG